MSTPVLYVGNKNYSSWSLRPWLALAWAGVDFDTKVIPLGGDHYGKMNNPAILAVSATGRVPALHLSSGRVVLESLAIAEWAAESATEPGILPKDRELRAQCRAVSAEMHSGFGAVRSELPMNIRRRTEPRDWSDLARHEIQRLIDLWQELLAEHGGPFLFGHRTIADAMYAPVCTRFRTYGVELPAAASAYCDAVFADADFKRWERDALAEEWAIESTDAV